MTVGRNIPRIDLWRAFFRTGEVNAQMSEAQRKASDDCK